MSKIDTTLGQIDADEVVAPLSSAEVLQLRRLLAVARYDEARKGFVIDTGRAKLLVRDDGTVRIEGDNLTVMTDGLITLNGAAIGLNS